jgi:hypothetical protein
MLENLSLRQQLLGLHVQRQGRENPNRHRSEDGWRNRQ